MQPYDVTAEAAGHIFGGLGGHSNLAANLVQYFVFHEARLNSVDRSYWARASKDRLKSLAMCCELRSWSRVKGRPLPRKVLAHQLHGSV